MSEVTSAFLEEVKDQIDAAKLRSFHLKERIVKQRVEYHVCITRILSNMWNGNGDEWVSVYEANDATKTIKVTDDALKDTLQKILTVETSFCAAIQFNALKVDKG
jgi:hypothetical protein